MSLDQDASPSAQPEPHYRDPAARARPEPTTREEARLLVRLALPIALAQFAQILLSLTDTAIVGRTDPVALAGTGMGRSVSFAFFSLFIGVAGALDPLASQAIGAGEPRRAWSAFTSALRANLLLTPFVIALVFMGWFAVSRLGVDPSLSRACLDFLLGHALGGPLFGAFLCARGYLQSQGNTRPIVVAAIIANLVNVPVCLFFVRVLHWGAFGAGISTTIASAVLTGISLRAAFKLRPSAPPTEGERVAVSKVLRLSVPVGLQMLAEIGVFSLVGVLTGRFGAVQSGAHQIALSLASFTFMGALGVSAATATRVGLAVGESRSPRRPGLLGIAVGTAIMSVGALAFALVPHVLVALFTNDAAVIRAAVPLLMIAALFQLFDGAQGVAGGALRGIADVNFAFVANVVAHWFIGLPVALVLAFKFDMGVVGLWWGLTLGLVVVAISCTLRFLQRAKGVVARV
jgi:MATE family multidrug resistance protein